MPNLSEIFIALRFQGTRNALRAVTYALYRDWLNWKYRKNITESAQPEMPGTFQEYIEIQPGTYLLKFTHLSLELRFLKKDMVRVQWYETNQEPTAPIPYAINRMKWEPVSTNLSETNDGFLISSEQLLVQILRSGDIYFCNSNDTCFNKQNSPRHIGDLWRLVSESPPEECVFGLGEQSKYLNLVGSTSRLWNTDAGGSYGPNIDPLYMPLPVFLGINHSCSYLIFHENPFPGEITFENGEDWSKQHRETVVEFRSPSIQYYFVLGEPGRCLENFSELTGRAPLPPLWSLGYHQSRWGYKTQQDILEVAGGFEQNDMPLSSIHLDIDYMLGYRVFTVDPERFPNLARLAESVHQKGVHLVAILDPGVKVDPGYDVYRNGIQLGAFCKLPNGKVLKGLVWPGWSVYPDFTNPSTRKWWKGYYKRLFSQGIDGIWHDMNEPTSFSAWGRLHLPKATLHSLDGRDSDHEEAHNLYALQMNRCGYEASQEHSPDKRPWLLSRSGWVGNQRFAWNWTGDTASTWEALKMTIGTVLGLGLSGIPYSGPDIGGFSGDPEPELYLRWFQMACFMPFFRTHSAVGTPRREPYTFNEPYKSILRTFLKLRYQLLPYLYTLAWETSQTGAPLVRPLFWDDPDNPALWDRDDEFLLGSALLIAPVTELSGKFRQVYFPSGEWYNFWDSSESVFGPDLSPVTVKIDNIPVFVRAGNILPFANNQNLVLNIYPHTTNLAQPGTYNNVCQLYSDAGDGYGTWRLDKFQITQTRDVLTIKRSVTGINDTDIYPFSYHNIILQLHGLNAVNMWVDNRKVTGKGVNFRVEDFNTLKFKLSH